MVLSINIVGSASAICPAVASPAKKATAPPIILLLRFTSSLFADKMVANLGEACGANASAPALIVANNTITFMFQSYGCRNGSMHEGQFEVVRSLQCRKLGLRMDNGTN